MQVDFYLRDYSISHLTRPSDWLKNLAPIFYQILTKATQCHTALGLRYTYLFGGFFLVHWIVYVLCDWPE